MPWTLGDRVKAARLALGLTQDELAKPDLSKNFISLLERDLARPSAATLERIARRLGKPVSFFLGDHQAEVSLNIFTILDNRGRGELDQQRYDAALAVFTEMHELAASAADDRMEMCAVLGQGEALLALRRLEEARTYLNDALSRAQEAQDALVECHALHGLATVEQRNANFPQAVSLYEAALAVMTTLSITEPVLHGEIFFYYGTALHRMGRLEGSSEAYTQAQRIFEAAFPGRVGEVRVSHSVALYLSGDYHGALLRLGGLEQYKDLRTLSWAHNNLGMVLLEVGRSREALEHFSESLAIKQRLPDAVGECHTLTELARCYFAWGNTERAHEYGLQAIARCIEARVPDEEARAQIVVAKIAAAISDFRKAERYLLCAAATCERASMTLELVTAFRELARMVSIQGRYKEAIMYHEKAFAVLRTMSPHDATAAVRMADLVGQVPRITATANPRRPPKE